MGPARGDHPVHQLPDRSVILESHVLSSSLLALGTRLRWAPADHSGEPSCWAFPREVSACSLCGARVQPLSLRLPTREQLVAVLTPGAR